MDISDHFPIFYYIDEEIILNRKGKEAILKRKINSLSILTFKNILSIYDWEALFSENYPDIAYNEFGLIFSKAYDSAFPEIQMKVKTKTLLSPGINTDIKKSSQKKQKLYEKFLKRQTYNSERTYENYKNLFEKIKSSFTKL